MKRLGAQHVGLLFLAVANMLPAVEADDSWWILGLAAICAVSSVALTRRAGGSVVPSWLVLIGVLGALAYSIQEMLTPQTVYILDLARFIILLACCKFFELNTHRDAALVALISFLLLIIGAFVSASPTYGFVLFIDVTIGVAWLLKFQTQRERAVVLARQQAALAFVRPAGGVARSHEVTVQSATWRPTLSLAIGLLVICGVIFITVPRGWGRGLFGRIQQVMPITMTGIAEDIQLRDATIIQDPTLVLRAKFTFAGQPYGGEDFQPYLRSATFDRYQNNRWQPTRARILSEVSPMRDGRTVMLPHIPSSIRGDIIIEQDIWLESLNFGRLISLYPPISIGTKDLRRVQQSLGDLTLQTSDTFRGPISYHVASLSPLASELASSPDAPLRTRWAKYSSIHPAVMFFAREVFAPGGEWRERVNHPALARRICEFLRSDEFRYTLDRGAGEPETDRIKEFLFNHSDGHCEYFASTMAVMCQSMNIPARVVSGYYGGEYNNVGNFYQFRARDAHAWVEVWTDAQGWMTFDPSPPSAERLVKREDTFWSRFQRFSDFMRFKWATSVVSFDAASRRELFESFEDWLRIMVEIRHRPQSVGEGVAVLLWGPDMLPFWKRVAYWMLLILFVVFVALVLRLLWILSLMVREWLIGVKRVSLVRRPAARFYDRLLLLLANKGHVKPRHLTPREFARDLAASVPDLRDLPAITEWYYEAQYGDGRIDDVRWRHIKSVLARLREDAAFAAN